LAWELEGGRYRLVVGIPHVGNVTMAWALSLRFLQLPSPSLFVCSRGEPIDSARNRAVRSCLRHGADAVAFLDSDLVVEPDAFMRLLSWDLPMVGGLYRFKNPPFHLQIYYMGGDGKFYTVSNPPRLIEDGGRLWIPAEEMEGRVHPYFESGGGILRVTREVRVIGRERFRGIEAVRDRLLPVDGMGLGVSVIKREIFESLEEPWFVMHGEHRGQRYGEDLYFFARVRDELGVKPSVDLSVWGEHIIYSKVTRDGVRTLEA